MALVAALAAVNAAIMNITADGLANGQPYTNTAMPSTSHIRAHLKWPLNNDGSNRSLVDHVCRYARIDLDAPARDALAATVKAEIAVAVIIAVARAAAWRYYGWERASLNVAETVVLAQGAADLAVHADHEAALADALTEWAVVSPRYMALVFYNAISYETSNHHHLPATTKKLATTTIQLAGLRDFIAGNAEREGSIFHDAFHCVADSVKSVAARNVAAQAHLSNLKFDNLRKRIPVKAPDCGIAINYSVLFRKARAYRHNAAHIPDGLAPPANLARAVTAYEAAPDPAALTLAVGRLRALSTELTEPSAYLAGLILGFEATATGDPDLELRTAARTCTILGSPAYARAAGEFSGTFAAGRQNGAAAVPAATPDQVIPRCLASVTAAAAL